METTILYEAAQWLQIFGVQGFRDFELQLVEGLGV